ncbi:MAG: MBL fold metallo-hydrolase, partial [Deltaproteobacteria bacterium]|nr:MBL fold metallo-hydrolase [Deltaproteobacteria bacterium]
ALLEATGRLERVTGSTSVTLGAGYSFHYSDGHTPGLMMARIEADDPGPINYVSDQIPGVPWIHAPITMGYDRFPELLIDEKLETLERIASGNEWLVLTHDSNTALCRVQCDERGRYSAIDEHPKLRSAA